MQNKGLDKCPTQCVTLVIMSRGRININQPVQVGEAAKALGRSRETIYRWIEEGKLIAVEFGGVLFVPSSEIERIKKEVADSLSATS